MIIAKVFESEDDVANAIAMLDGTELNGNTLLGVKPNFRFPEFNRDHYIIWDPFGGNQTSSKCMLNLRDFPYNNALFGWVILHIAGWKMGAPD